MRTKKDRRSLAAMDGLGIPLPSVDHVYEPTQTDDEASAKKKKTRRSLGGKIEKRKSSKFSKLSLKTLFTSNKTSPLKVDNLNIDASVGDKTTRKNSGSDSSASEKDELNRTRDAGHTPKNSRVFPVHPKIIIDLIQPQDEVKKEPTPMAAKKFQALAEVTKNQNDGPKKESKKKSKKESWRRRTIGIFCGVRRRDPGSTGSDSPFENRIKENMPYPALRRSPRISTSTPIGVTEAIARVNSLVLSGETPITTGHAEQVTTQAEPVALDVFTPKRNLITVPGTKGRRLIQDRQCKSAVKEMPSATLGTKNKVFKRKNSLLHAMAESQLVTMDTNGSMHVSGSPNDQSDPDIKNHSILSNLSKYKIKMETETVATPTGLDNVTTRRRKLDVSHVSDKSTSFDKSLNLSGISAINQNSWLDRSLNAKDNHPKVTRSKSQKTVTMDVERVEIIKKGRRSVSLRRRLSSMKKREDEKPKVVHSNRLDAGHTPRVDRKKKKAIDERLI